MPHFGNGSRLVSVSHERTNHRNLNRLRNPTSHVSPSILLHDQDLHPQLLGTYKGGRQNMKALMVLLLEGVTGDHVFS